MPKKCVLIVGFLALLSLACVLTSTIDRIRQGKRAIETAQGVATRIDAQSFKKTAGAAATQAGDSGFSKTAQAVATEMAVEPGDVPPDIPILPGEKFAFVGSEQVISYAVEVDFQTALDFYQVTMPAKGWVMAEVGTVIGERSADLHYEKPGRKVGIAITQVPFVGQVSVVISMK